ncbi:ABC-ATPase domain-containing protein [Varibaculum cambriense]|uniref:ABC-ATPase domain-containing protein n=1 Tax=Varibaculum cambriense TaxID=184870 RepID=UPI0025543B08|nr:ABC-ATPase domain-containing protein [Varibaculum cambriense]MDK8273810.1 ABC-ATPase domain-containing protein [Varibaculum cambriense]
MRDADELIRKTKSLDGRSYGGYKQLVGQWSFGDFTFAIDRVQSDPFAPPSACRVLVPLDTAQIPAEIATDKLARIATGDFLARRARKIFGTRRSGGKSEAQLRIAPVGQEILARSSVTLSEDGLELRVQVPFPAAGRRILGRNFARFLDYDLCELVYKTVCFGEDDGPDLADLTRHIHTLKDHAALQKMLSERGWVAFVADGALLARASGISDLPMKNAVPFHLPTVLGEDAPSPLVQSVELPYSGEISGMAIPKGITVIVGGGYHGKSTLLEALERAVYPHIPGDGRELVATLPDAIKVRAEDGRAITGTDISLFISSLPGGSDTRQFFTENASGSTSQAAAITEAIECGSRALLIDEDTSATNLLLRDSRMRQLVRSEPIIPLIDRVGGIREELGVSTIMVMGGSGDFLDLADQVLLLENYLPYDATARAREVSRGEVAASSTDNAVAPWPQEAVHKRLLLSCPPPPAGRREKTRAEGTATLRLNREEIDISALAQVVDPGQAEAIAYAIRALVTDATGKETIADACNRFATEFASSSWQAFAAGRYPAFLAAPRLQDIFAALCRYRHLKARSTQVSR